MKPDIVFFGESLREDFTKAEMVIKNTVDDDAGCDLMIIIGTAMAVAPFKSIVRWVDESVPKVLINMTKIQAYDFDSVVYFPNRLFLEGKCDDVIEKLVVDCGW